MKTPVGGYRGNLTVVVVEVVIGGSDELLGYGVAEEDTQDSVLYSISLVFIEGDQDEGVLHESLVVEQRLDKSASPGTGNSDVRVMTVARHVGSNEHPLRQLSILEVLVELSEVLVDGEAVKVAGIGVVVDRGVMLANVVILAVHMVYPGLALEATVGHIFLVMTPRDALIFKKIDNGGHILVRLEEVVVLHTEIVSSDGGNVVRL